MESFAQVSAQRKLQAEREARARQRREEEEEIARKAAFKQEQQEKKDWWKQKMEEEEARMFARAAVMVKPREFQVTVKVGEG